MTSASTWALRRMGELVTLTSGQSPSGFKFGPTGTPYYKVDQLGRSQKYLGRSSTPYFSPGLPAVPAGSVLIAKRGGAIALNRVRLITKPSFMDTNVMALTPGTEVDSEFLYYWLVYRGLWDIADVTSVPQINNKHIIPLQIALPDLAEQREIVTALRDTDAVIIMLGRLIAKKQAIKQGMLQHLLTRRTCLPGFHEEWATAPLMEFLPLQRGYDLPASQVRPGPYPVVYSNGIARNHAQAMASGPGVATGRSGTIGNVHYVEKDYWPHNTSLWVTSFARVEPLFAYYFLSYLGLERFASGSGVPTFNRNDAHSFPVTLPTDRGEQAAIAKILRGADAELSALAKRLAKEREVKQGIMQQLLTGRTRLPLKEGTA